MSKSLNNNRIYITLILCIAVVSSVWLFQRDPNKSQVSKSVSLDVITPTSNIKLENTDWEKILVKNSKSDVKIENVSNTTYDSLANTSLTSQLSKELFSRYLLLAKGGQKVSQEDAEKIAADVLRSSDYTNNTGTQYIESSLIIKENNSKESILKYNEVLYSKLRERALKIKIDPIIIFSNVIKTDDYTGLDQLNPLIIQLKGVISDLVLMEVPKEAASFHLAILNSYSNILANVESIKTTKTDPVKGINGVTAYAQHVDDLKISFNNINSYFQDKLGRF